jgi:multicomponent Na+:H+ antiporter subunit G
MYMIEMVRLAGMVVGVLFVLAASIGMVRLPDLFLRMATTTKAATVGLGLVLIAVAVAFADLYVTIRIIVIAIFLVLTVPVAAHALGRAAYRSGIPLWTGTVLDELRSYSGSAFPHSLSLPCLG